MSVGSSIAGGAASGAAAGAVLGPWGALAGGVLGAGLGWWQGDAQSSVEDEKKKFEQMKLAEELRRFDVDANRTKGMAQAIAAASGASFQSTSLQEYLSNMGNEFKRQREWMRMAGGKQLDLYAQQQDVSAQSEYLQAAMDIGKGVAAWGSANNWGLEPADSRVVRTPNGSKLEDF